MSKYSVEVKVVIDIEADDREGAEQALSEMDYSFISDKGEKLESEIIDWEIKE